MICNPLRTAVLVGSTALVAFGATSVPRAIAEELDAATGPHYAGYLVPEDALGDVRLSVIDEKLAMSLAVETWVQIGLAEYALPTIRDDELRAMTEAKLLTYRKLLNTVDYLTDGEASAMLEDAATERHRTAATSVSADGSAPDTTNASPSHPTRDRSRSVGLRGILRKTATKAILKVRLQIAEQYAELLRTELALAPPGEFDRSYLGIEVYSQMQWLSMLRVFGEQASADFAKVLAHATSHAETHVAAGRKMFRRLGTSPTLTDQPEQVVETVEPAGS